MESSTEFFECEKEKLFSIGNNNIENLLKIKKFVDLLDQIEIATNEKIVGQLEELAELQTMSREMFAVFKNICINLLEHQINKI